jgi:Divergent InlB B-repeat domain
MRRSLSIGVLGAAVAIALSGAADAQQGNGGRIVLRGEGSGTVHYVAEGPSIPSGRSEGDCPEQCSVDWPLQGLTITLTATPLEDSRFGGWGGMCASARTNPTCTFTGVAGMNVVEARFLPPKQVRFSVPLRGRTTLRLAPAFTSKLRRQGWTARAIPPAKLAGRVLTLPISSSGPLTIVRKTSPLVVEQIAGECVINFPPARVVHHSGGLQLSRPGGRLSRLPLDRPALSWLTGSPSLLFREGRDHSTQVGKGGARLGRTGFAANLIESRAVLRRASASVVRYTGVTAKLWDSSWDGLLAFSPKPAITSGVLGTIEVSLSLPIAACR